MDSLTLLEELHDYLCQYGHLTSFIEDYMNGQRGYDMTEEKFEELCGY